MYEYRTASFLLKVKKNGAPLEEVDAALNAMLEAGWEFVQLTHGVDAVLSVVLLLRRLKQDIGSGT